MEDIVNIHWQRLYVLVVNVTLEAENQLWEILRKEGLECRGACLSCLIEKLALYILTLPRRIKEWWVREKRTGNY